MITMQK